MRLNLTQQGAVKRVLNNNNSSRPVGQVKRGDRWRGGLHLSFCGSAIVTVAPCPGSLVKLMRP